MSDSHSPIPAPPAAVHEDERDAWLDDVRRWYYGGTEPAERAELGERSLAQPDRPQAFCPPPRSGH